MMIKKTTRNSLRKDFEGMMGDSLSKAYYKKTTFEKNQLIGAAWGQLTSNYADLHFKDYANAPKLK